MFVGAPLSPTFGNSVILYDAFRKIVVGVVRVVRRQGGVAMEKH